jgi:hypothetical protein
MLSMEHQESPILATPFYPGFAFLFVDLASFKFGCTTFLEPTLRQNGIYDVCDHLPC